MSYDDAHATILDAWTDENQRKPKKFTITGYYDGNPVGSPVVVYTEQEMEATFANMRNLAMTTKIYDQVRVQEQDIVVPSLTE
jgi:hypothetical protein